MEGGRGKGGREGLGLQPVFLHPCDIKPVRKEQVMFPQQKIAYKALHPTF